MKKTALALIALAFVLAFAAQTPIATRPWVQTQISNAMATQTGRGYVYTATVVTNENGTFTYTAPFTSSELTNCVSLSLTYAVCTNRALRLSYSTIPGVVTNRMYYAWNGTCYTNCNAALKSIWPYTATNTAGNVYQSYRASGVDGTEYDYRNTLGAGTLYAKTNAAWSARIGLATIGDVMASRLKGE